jgi:hypothetical protein
VTYRSDLMVTTITGETLIGLVLSIPCDYCRARVGDHCKTRDGEVLLLEEGFPVPVHVHRVTPVYLIFRLGYRHGRRDMKKKLSEPTE